MHHHLGHTELGDFRISLKFIPMDRYHFRCHPRSPHVAFHVVGCEGQLAFGFLGGTGQMAKCFGGFLFDSRFVD